MKGRALAGLVISLTVLTAFWSGAALANEVTPQYVVGDHPAYRLIDTAIPAEAVRREAPQGLHWIRIPVTLEGPTSAPQALVITLTGAFEVYWDGTLLGAEGVPSAPVGRKIAAVPPNRALLHAAHRTPDRLAAQNIAPCKDGFASVCRDYLWDRGFGLINLATKVKQRAKHHQHSCDQDDPKPTNRE